MKDVRERLRKLAISTKKLFTRAKKRKKACFFVLRGKGKGQG
jgi:hypothetical protein